MNSKHITVSVLFSMLIFFFSGCALIDTKPAASGEKGITYIIINAEDGRSVLPAVSLTDVTFELFGEKDGGPKTSLKAGIDPAAGASLVIDAGTWDFTLTGSKNSNPVVEGALTGQTISAGTANTLAFEVAPPFTPDAAGTGTVKVTINLPGGSGVTSAEAEVVTTTNTDPAKIPTTAELGALITIAGSTVTLEGAFPVGDFFVSVTLKDSGSTVKATVSELVRVRANLASEKEITLTAGDLKDDMVVVKKIVFDDLNNFKMTGATGTMPLAEKDIYEFQRGGELRTVGWGTGTTGGEGGNGGISTAKDHTNTGGGVIGKSFRWYNVDYADQRVKFDKIFSPADEGRTFAISLWMYSDINTQVKLAAFSMSGTSPATGSPTTSVSPVTLSLTGGAWTKLDWQYTHTAANVSKDVTQFAVAYVTSPSPSAAQEFFIDDIVIKATPINETGKKNITFESGSLVENIDWQAANWPTVTDPTPQPVTVALSAEQNHTSGGSKSLKFSGRDSTPQASKSCAVKLNDVFTGASVGDVYKITAWVYNPAASGGVWIQLGVYASDGNAPVARHIARVESAAYLGGDGWSKVEWKGYKHTASTNTQLGIATPTDVGRFNTLYIDDIVVTKVR